MSADSAILKVAAGLLRDALEQPIDIVGVQMLSEEDRRNLLLRLELSGGPKSVILKQAERGGDSVAKVDWNANRFACDWAGAQFLSDLGFDHGPRFYGGSQEHRFVLLEDLGEKHRSLVEPLLEGTPESVGATLERYATRLGRLHADTFGRHESYAAILRGLRPTLPSSWLIDFGNGLSVVHKARALMAQLIDLELSVDAELETVLSELQDREDFFVYLRGDGCPDNVFETPFGLKLIDFEFGHYGHALLDACYPRMTMPTCWCAGRLPLAQIEAFEARYRTELALACPAVQGDGRFQTALVSACAFWLLTTLGRRLEHALEVDSESKWGLTTIRPRILAQLEAFADLAHATALMPAFRSSAVKLCDVLSRRWPDTRPADLYPAFGDHS